MTTGKGNIWERSNTLASATMMLNKRRCWETCHDCQLSWGKVDPPTIYVHMKIFVQDGKQETRFICDQCLINSKEE